MYMIAIPLEAARRLHVEYARAAATRGSFRAPPRRRAGHRRRRPADGVQHRGGGTNRGRAGGCHHRRDHRSAGFLAVVMCVLAALAIARSLSATCAAAAGIAVLQALGAAPADAPGGASRGRYRPPRRSPGTPCPWGSPGSPTCSRWHVARFPSVPIPSSPSRYGSLPSVSPSPWWRRCSARSPPPPPRRGSSPARTLSWTDRSQPPSPRPCSHAPGSEVLRVHPKHVYGLLKRASLRAAWAGNGGAPATTPAGRVGERRSLQLLGHPDPRRVGAALDRGRQRRCGGPPPVGASAQAGRSRRLRPVGQPGRGGAPREGDGARRRGPRRRLPPTWERSGWQGSTW